MSVGIAFEYGSDLGSTLMIFWGKFFEFIEVVNEVFSRYVYANEWFIGESVTCDPREDIHGSNSTLLSVPKKALTIPTYYANILT